MDFRNLQSNFNIFSNPFQSAPEQSLDEFQLEMINLQSKNDMKSAFKENDLLTFYKNYVREKCPNLVEYALKTILLFGSTYCCEQFFLNDIMQRKAKRPVIQTAFEKSISNLL